jgi:hypothetical protein
VRSLATNRLAKRLQPAINRNRLGEVRPHQEQVRVLVRGESALGLHRLRERHKYLSTVTTLLEGGV